MGTSRRKARTRAPRFKVGDRVRFMFGVTRVTAVIIEDRGCLGAEGRRLYTIRARVDTYSDFVFEMPEDELQAA